MSGPGKHVMVSALLALMAMSISDALICRGADVEPAEQVKGVVLKRIGDELEISWQRFQDQTVTAYYCVYAGKEQVAETDRLSIKLQASTVIDVPLTVVAYDLYGNPSAPTEPIYVCGGQ